MKELASCILGLIAGALGVLWLFGAILFTKATEAAGRLWHRP